MNTRSNFIAFLKNVKFYLQQVEVEKVDSKNFYISVFDETNYVSFYEELKEKEKRKY